jgi:hypothetical protein
MSKSKFRGIALNGNNLIGIGTVYLGAEKVNIISKNVALVIYACTR